MGFSGAENRLRNTGILALILVAGWFAIPDTLERAWSRFQSFAIDCVQPGRFQTIAITIVIIGVGGWILQGLLKSCEKRPVAMAKLEALVDEVERFVLDAPERERTTAEIGELLMSRLKKLDKVAYVRFASVYLDFKDVKEFMAELKGLLRDRAKK